MSEFIVAGIVVIAGVIWLYSRFCEERRQSSRDQKEGTVSRGARVRL
jgi:hypothetical protein